MRTFSILFVLLLSLPLLGLAEQPVLLDRAPAISPFFSPYGLYVGMPKDRVQKLSREPMRVDDQGYWIFKPSGINHPLLDRELDEVRVTFSRGMLFAVSIDEELDVASEAEAVNKWGQRVDDFRMVYKWAESQDQVSGAYLVNEETRNARWHLTPRWGAGNGFFIHVSLMRVPGGKFKNRVIYISLCFERGYGPALRFGAKYIIFPWSQ